MRAILIVMALCGCGGSGIDPGPDGAQPDFFGEACKSTGPSATVCHSDRGWCIDDVCRPMCGQERSRCTDGAASYTDDGACYCAPM